MLYAAHWLAAGTYTLPVYNFFDEIIIYIYMCIYTKTYTVYIEIDN